MGEKGNCHARNPAGGSCGLTQHVSAEYYYRIPVPPIYKGYPVYAPGHGPAGYMDWLRHQEPVIVWDDAGHAPPLKTDADWIKAGETVFDAPTDFDRFVTLAETRDPAWYKRIGTPVRRTVRFHFWVTWSGKKERSRPVRFPVPYVTQKLTTLLNLPAMVLEIPIALMLPRGDDRRLLNAALPFVPLGWYCVGRWLDGLLGYVRRSRVFTQSLERAVRGSVNRIAHHKRPNGHASQSSSSL